MNNKIKEKYIKLKNKLFILQKIRNKINFEIKRLEEKISEYESNHLFIYDELKILQ